MTPKALILEWVRRFNRGDVDGLAALYAEDAVNHQVVMDPLIGRAEIRRLRGCGFFQVQNEQIVRQRGYFDQLSFFRKQGLAVPESYLGPA